MTGDRLRPARGLRLCLAHDVGARSVTAHIRCCPLTMSVVRTDVPQTREPAAGNAQLADLGLRHATADDIHRLKTVLAEAFYEDPMFGWLMPNDSKRHARLRHYFGIELRHYALPRGRVWTTDDLAGAMLSLPPGRWRVPPHATLLHGSAFGVRVAKAARVGAAMERRHSRLLRGPHYYVRDIGVRPDAQGRGLGSALMRPTLDRCDK